jgi:hypothetical protein
MDIILYLASDERCQHVTKMASWVIICWGDLKDENQDEHQAPKHV